jgi:pantoate--beta-alanine ligase
MPTRPRAVRTVKTLRTRVAAFRAASERVALVPTMGALHDGHLSLVKAARRHAARVVVSIFVNPTQFAAHEDLDRYPRDEAGDLEKLATVAADLVFAPSREEMYGEGFSTRILMEGGVAEGLESVTRPHFFGGVATVVAKLLLQSGADVAMFGEKDYQQLQVVRRLVRDLDIPTKIIGVPTLRENDGLAMSSRNAYLSAEERRVAPVLHRTISEIAGKLSSGARIAATLAAGRKRIEDAGFRLDYLELRDADTLRPLAEALLDRPARILVAAMLGRTRLIDNLPVAPFSGSAGR